ncbi:MAG TPA: hypothetical protein VFR23_16440 [Jiangellaceae bacterium]|nr:hypothetical protein [Jiangellaceae bacterium]
MTAALDFEEIADELYGLRPDEFIEARDEHVARAKGDGNKALARDLGKLRRPTQAAWLVNALWRDRREDVEELLALTDDFGAAMAAGDGKQLQALTATRRELEGRLIQRATALAADAGAPAGADMLREVQETLGAALVSSEAAGQVRSGRLVRPLSYAGFGPGLSAVGQVSPAKPVRKKAPSSEAAARTGRVGAGSAKAAKPDEVAEARRAAAERDLAEARELVSAAADELDKRARAAEDAAEQYATLSDRLAELREQVRELDQQVVTAKQVAAREQRRRTQAENAYERARAAVERAEQRLE